MTVRGARVFPCRSPRMAASGQRERVMVGMNFSVNTDEPGPFACSLTSELELLEQELGFTPSDFARIRNDAWRSRFGSRSTLHHTTSGNG